MTIAARTRLADLMMATAAATDLGMGQPIGSAAKACWLATRFAQTLQLGPLEQHDVYYLALLHFLGCTTNASDFAAFVGNDTLAMQRLIVHHMGVVPDGLGQPLPQPLPLINRETALEANRSSCDVAARLAAACGLSASVQTGLWQLFEHWDGTGLPSGLRGEAISIGVQVVQIARDFITFSHLLGIEAARTVLHKRAGQSFDPALVEAFDAVVVGLIAELDAVALVREAIITLEPSPHLEVDANGVNRVLEALSDFAALKSPWSRGHARAVAELVGRVSTILGADANLLRSAALVQDVGHVALSATLLNKPGRLSDLELEQVRLHPYHSERVLKSARYLEPLVNLVASHHERLNGSGYYRSLPAAMLNLSARILAVSDVCQAMSEDRPYRTKLSNSEVKREMLEACKQGLFDVGVVEAVLSILNDGAMHARIHAPNGLSPREVEVLRLLARSESNRLIAERLSITPKTVGHHVQHIYEKLNVNTRAAATLYAMQHHLL
jgi:HD-GYP domain-containing protein (c-di-GMP phosphodiesterase class II)